MMALPEVGAGMKVVRPLEPGAQSRGQEPGAPGISAGWVVLGLSCAEFLGIGGSDFQDRVAQAESVHSWAELAGPGIDAIAVLSPEVAELFPQSTANLSRDVMGQDLWMTVLVPWREPPTRSIRADGLADSFCCSPEVFSELLKTLSEVSGERLCFSLLDAILNGRIAVQNLLVRQLPLDESCASPVALPQNAALIMAHRGPKQFLTSALRFVTAAACHSQVKVRVGLDVEDVSGYRDLAEIFPAVEFYGVDGAPVGPYVIRQTLIDLSSEHLIVFHDSDDISCQDRIAR